MSTTEAKELYYFWVKSWNDDSTLLDRLVDPECIVHQERTDGRSSYGPKGTAALKGLIEDSRALFTDIHMSVEVGPIVEEPFVSARWKFTGTYKGDMPGAKAAAGKAVFFHGMDIFLLKEGKIKEYWISSDGVDLMQQLEVF